MTGNSQLSVVEVVGNSIVGGAETQVLWLLHGLRERGVQLPVVVCPMEGPFTDILREEGFPVATATMGVWEDEAPLDDGSVDALQQILQRVQPDVLHCHMHPAMVYGAEAARRAGVTGITYTGHGIEPITPADVGIPAREGFPAIAVAEAVAERLRDAGLAPELIEVIYNGVPQGFFSADRRAAQALRREFVGDAWPVLGSVARLSWEKGADQAIRALPHVLREYPETRLLLVGEGPEGDILADLASELGVSRNVLFLGTRRDTAVLYQTFDVFLLPSRSEACPLALLEAMAAGIPVVAATVGGVPEIVRDGLEGILVRREEPRLLAEGILVLLRNEALRQRCGRAARHRVATCFTADQMVDRTLALYRRLAMRETTAGGGC